MPDTSSSGTGVTSASVEQTLARGFRLLRFPAALEARFEADTGAERSRQLVARGIAALVLFNLFLLSDWVLFPDQVALANVLRLGIISPVALATLVLIAGNPRPILREGSQAMIGVLAAVVPPILILSSDAPLRMAGHHGILLVILYLTMVQRIRFWYALPAVLLIEVVYAGTLLSLPALEPELRLSFNMVFAGGVLFALIASYSLERELRRSYLLGLREKLVNASLENLSRHDAMTSLGNRRALDEVFATLEAGEPTGPTAVVLFDIDHFKAYNDSLGHLAGDVCLKRVAGIVLAEMREEGDVAFRFGGEEFLVMLHNTDLPAAIGVAERLRRAIEDAAIPHPARSGPPVVTASFGVASARIGSIVSGSDLTASADAALYAAKRAGRNQVWPPFLAARSASVAHLSDHRLSGRSA